MQSCGLLGKVLDAGACLGMTMCLHHPQRRTHPPALSPPSTCRSYKRVVLKDSRDLNPGEHSLFGAVAGAFTGLVTTPLDVLKTRMMLDGAKGEQQGMNLRVGAYGPRVLVAALLGVLKARRCLMVPRLRPDCLPAKE